MPRAGSVQTVTGPEVAHGRPGGPTADSVSAGCPGATDDATTYTPASEICRCPRRRHHSDSRTPDGQRDIIGTRPLSPCLPGPLIKRSGYVAFAATRPGPVPQVDPSRSRRPGFSPHRSSAPLPIQRPSRRRPPPRARRKRGHRWLSAAKRPRSLRSWLLGPKGRTT